MTLDTGCRVLAEPAGLAGADVHVTLSLQKHVAATAAAVGGRALRVSWRPGFETARASSQTSLPSSHLLTIAKFWEMAQQGRAAPFAPHLPPATAVSFGHRMDA